MDVTFKFRFTFLLSVLLLVLGIWFFRFQTISSESRSSLKTISNPFEATLLEEPIVKEGRIFFHLEGLLVQTHSYESLHYGDRLKVYGEPNDSGLISFPKIEKTEGGQRGLFQGWFFNLRNRLIHTVRVSLPEPEASLLSGILLGVDEGFSGDFSENLRRSGTIHVVVVSGYNIAVLGGLVLGLAGYIRRRYALLLAIGTVILYTFLTGAQVPTIRAAIMSSTVYLAGIVGRTADSIYILFLTAALMLAWDPEIISSVSFQLSFLATLGIVSLAKFFINPLSRLPSPFREDLATTLAAQALVIPVIFFHFGQISLISPLVNALILWLIPLVTFGGILLLCLGLLILPLAQIFAWLIWLPLAVFVWVVTFAGQLPFASISVPEQSWWLVFGFYLIIFSFLLWLKLKDLKQN